MKFAKRFLLAVVLLAGVAVEARAQTEYVVEFSYASCQRMRTNQTLAYVFPNDPTVPSFRTGAILSSSLGSSPNYNVVACPVTLPFGSVGSLRPKKIEISYKFFSDPPAPTTQYFRCQLEVKSTQSGASGLTSQFQNPAGPTEGVLSLDLQTALAAGSYVTPADFHPPWLDPSFVNALTVLCIVPQSNLGSIEGYSLIYQ